MFLEVLIVADDVLKNLKLPNARHIFLEPGQGLVDVAKLAENQEMAFPGVKVIVVISGFAEIEARHPAIISSVLAVMRRLESSVANVKIVLASPVPNPSADKELLRQLFYFSKQLQKLCTLHKRFDFTKTGLLFYGPGGLYANMLDRHGATEQGLKLVTTKLMDKLKSVGVLLEQ